MTMTDWDACIDAHCRLLQDLAGRSEWEALGEAVADFSALLHRLPRDDAASAPRFERAHRAIAAMLPPAIEARAGLEVEIRRITKGRKAVSAYR